MKTIIRVIVALVVLAMTLMPLPALAIADPDTITIYDVWAYRHCLETNDQLYIVYFKVDYAVNPTENITEAYLARLMLGAAEQGSVAPYTYYDDGYAKGIASIYFTAALAPVWDNGQDIELSGNPTLAWGGAAHTDTLNITSWSSSTSLALTSGELSIKVLWLAAQLELDWSIDLIEGASGGGNQLTSYGETYFTNSIQNLNELTPRIFSIQEYEPSFPVKTYTQPYASSLAASVVGTPLDMEDVGLAFGISTMWVSSAIYALICVVLLVLVGRGTGSSKASLALTIPMVIVGALLGVLPLVAAILMGFIALVFTMWSLFGSKASA